MYKKKTVLIFLFVFLGVFALITIACNFHKELKSDNYSNEKEYEVSTYITDDIIANTQNCKVDLCLNEEYTPELIGEDADDIVIASVISLDGAIADEGLFGITTGKLLINTTIKGDLQQGQVIEYMKNGGVMKMSEWEATQPSSANSKRQYLREQSGNNINLDNTYINVSISDDIDIEEGYTYLIYLKKNQEKYEIIGLDVGLRKVNVNYSSRLRTQNLDIDTLEVMNNKTGEFESLQNYINTYISNGEKE